MKVVSKPLYILMVLAMLVGMLGIQPVKPVEAGSQALRISQVYGGGGNSGAPYTHDFIEIYNSGNSPVSLAGMSVQYAGATGTGNFGANITELPAVMLGAGQYYLIQEGSGSNGVALPTPDLIDATPIAMGATGGKVALVNSAVSLGCNGGSTPCSPAQLALIVDLVGFGNANFFEGTAAAPAPSNTTSVIRVGGGCTDDDQNSTDFVASDPTPRNTASVTHSCGPVEIFPTDLFFSEYIEGSSNHKALEIFNGTGNSVDLANYQILYFNNGSPTPTITYPLTGTVAAGDVYVLTTDAADPILKAAADVILVYPSVVHYNGDDALALQKISPLTTLDVIGQIGNDPGSAWGTEPITTVEHTLTRKDTVCEGDPDGSDPFDPALEWNGFAQNDFTHIGSHETNCFPPTEVAPTVLSTVPANSENNVAINASITITFSEPVTVSGEWFSISCGTSGTHTAAVTDADPIFTLNPDTDFVADETCTVTVLAANVNDDDLIDPPDYMASDYAFSFTIPAGCGATYTPIYEIQGTGETSPLAGTNLTTEGVVVGDFQVGGKAGYYIQDPTGDGNPATSDGIFVYNTSTDVNVGDHVRVAGKAVEFSGITEISPVTLVTICSTGNTIAPTPLTLPVAAVSDFEKYESMLVTFPQSLIISEYFNYDRYGEIVLTSTRHMTPTAFVEPGVDAQAAAQAYLLDRITMDDGRTTQNPDPAIHPNGLTFNMANLFRGGGTVTNATGILDFYQSLYRLQPTKGADYADVNPRTAAPEIIEGDVKVASFNVLNYFVTLDGGATAWICGPSGTMECRGADNAEEFTRQRNKILSALDAIDADVYGLMEIENDSPISGNDAVADLVAGLNVINGAGTYAYINTGAIGGDAIKQAILYKPAAVTPVGTYKLLTTAIDPRFIDDANRPVIAQVFKDKASGEEFVVAVNHLKSKGSACSGDPDLGDGAGNCNLTRKAAAEALVDWLANPAYFPDVEKALIIGDLNSYDKEDPIDMIRLGADDAPDTADDFKDMVFEKRGELAYGYVFDGQTGYLDHALASKALSADIVDVNFWHINADEPDLIDYDTSFKLPAQDALYAPDAYRSSDHDPVIVTMSFTPFEVTDVDLLRSTDPDTLEASATDVPGNLTDGFTAVLDPTIPWYYFDTDTITSSVPLADGSYPFYLEGTTTEIFTLVVNGNNYFLRDTYADDGTPLRVQGTFALGPYTYVGEVRGVNGLTDEVSLTITFVAPLAVTDVALVQSTDLSTWTPVEGDLAEGYVMNLDTAVEYYYLDAASLTSNRPLADGSYPFLMTGNPGAEFFAYWAERGVVEGATGWQALMWQIINGDAPMFYLKVEGANITLIDGLQGDPNPLRVNGGYYPGLYTFSGTVADQFGFGDVVDVSIFFNDIPVAENQAVTTPEDTAIDITLAATDSEGEALVYAIAAQPAHGTVTVSGNIATYTPATDFVGEDSFTFTANDGTVDSNIATVTITVTPINDAPEAVDDAYEVDEDDVLTVAAPGVMTNDIEVDSDGMRVVLVSGVSHGELDLMGDGSFTYTPDPDFNGTDSFVYRLVTFPDVQDDWTDDATVTITVHPVNDAPEAEDQDVTTAEDTAKDITLVGTDIDGDSLTYAIVDQPAHGSVSLAGSIATYTPASDFVGEDSFTFTATDGTATSAMAVVTITVTPVNDAPVAVEDAYSTDEDTVLTVLVADGVLDNDSDVDGDTLMAILVSDVSNGDLVLADDGSFVYTPDEDYFGNDSFTYKASDGTLESNVVSVTITINPVNDWVVANDDDYETMAGVTLDVAAPGVLTNDVLLDPNETVSLAVLVQPTGGTLTLNNDGSFTYVPNAGFFGVDTFVYQLNTTVLLNGEFSDTAIVTIKVTGLQIFLPLILR